MNDHDNHQTMEREIAELSALERMRKRATDDDSTSLRNIYLEETRQSTELSSIVYAAVERSLYKRRRLHQPSLPSSLDAVADAIRINKYAASPSPPTKGFAGAL